MLEHLGKYRIDAILGQGAMGVVYKAYDPHIERVVALKTIRKELITEARQADLLGRFRNEAQAAGRLHHPNIVMVYDYGEAPEAAYIAMEFVDGAALNTLMPPDRPIAPARVHAWMADLLQALDYAHARGVVHRDIKPANLLIGAGSRVKVSDFGIARIDSSTLTQTGAMIGTPSYMSPEQFRGDAVDGRADVFSAGVLMYQLLTGVRPFVGTPATVMQQILNEAAAPPSHLLAALGTGYDQILQCAMAKRAADRFPSARAFLDALNQLGQAGPDGAAAAAAADPDPDRTVLAAAPPADPAAPARLASAATLGSGSDAYIMAPWQREALPELDTLLARQIGPMAKFLLKKVAARAAGIDDLCDLLLPHIPSELGRVEFQQGVAQVKKKLSASGTGSGAAGTNSTRNMGSTPGTVGGAGLASGMASATTSAAPVAYDADFVAASAQRLTVFIGPIAKVVAQRAARQTGDRATFLRLLAGHIEAPPERARFLADHGVA